MEASTNQPSMMTVSEACAIIRKTFIEDKQPRCHIRTTVGSKCFYFLESAPCGCAAGCLMPSDKARQAMEQWIRCSGEHLGAIRHDSVYAKFTELAPRTAELPRAFLDRIQAWHDDQYTFGNVALLDAIEADFSNKTNETV